VKFIGIRAHDIDFAEAGAALAAGNNENVFPCRYTQSSETPFRVTLFLTLESRPDTADHHPLQAEVFKEKWQRFRDQPFPWHLRLAPERLFLMPD
jgi:molybdate transport system permease protein